MNASKASFLRKRYAFSFLCFSKLSYVVWLVFCGFYTLKLKKFFCCHLHSAFLTFLPEAAKSFLWPNWDYNSCSLSSPRRTKSHDPTLFTHGMHGVSRVQSLALCEKLYCGDSLRRGLVSIYDSVRLQFSHCVLSFLVLIIS